MALFNRLAVNIQGLKFVEACGMAWSGQAKDSKAFGTIPGRGQRNAHGGRGTKQMDQLSIAVSLIVVVTGAFLNYYINISLAKKNRIYDLKRQIYLEIFDTLGRAHVYFRRGSVTYNPRDNISPEDLRKFDEIMAESFVDKFRLSLVDADEDIIQLIDQIYDGNTYSNPAKFDKLVNKELIPKMRNDLISSKSRWQFWK